MGQKPCIFLINTLIILTILMNIRKKYFLDLFLYTPNHSFLNVRQKKIFLQIFGVFFLEILPVQRGFFWKNHSSLTSVIGDIAYHATHRWKALEEYIPNIYTFLGEKASLFQINSLIIFTVFAKIYLSLL